MNPDTVEIVKATAPVLKEHGEKITQRMYEIAFQARPDTRRFFENTWMVNAEEGLPSNGLCLEHAPAVQADAASAVVDSRSKGRIAERSMGTH